MSHAPLPSHRLFEGEDLVVDCAGCGALAIGFCVLEEELVPHCALCHFGYSNEHWMPFPLKLPVYRDIPGVHPRLPVREPSEPDA